MIINEIIIDHQNWLQISFRPSNRWGQRLIDTIEQAGWSVDRVGADVPNAVIKTYNFRPPEKA